MEKGYYLAGWEESGYGFRSPVKRFIYSLAERLLAKEDEPPIIRPPDSFLGVTLVYGMPKRPFFYPDIAVKPVEAVFSARKYDDTPKSVYVNRGDEDDLYTVTASFGEERQADEAFPATRELNRLFSHYIRVWERGEKSWIKESRRISGMIEKNIPESERPRMPYLGDEKGIEKFESEYRKICRRLGCEMPDYPQIRVDGIEEYFDPLLHQGAGV